MSDKIQLQHLNRKAVLYVRQSSAYQVTHNVESQVLQYGMQERLRELGWQEIDVIDEDLGRSAAGGTPRAGFERMVADVCLGKVGAVAAREVSRFARNSRDWQQLVEVCRIVDTLLIDQDSVYSPRHSNDRLLLGLKGSMNEYELDLLRQRSLEARYEKARRGELIVAAPVGFLKTEDQRLEKIPDRRVQEAILLVFRKFQEIGSVRQTLLWFHDQQLQLPACRGVGDLTWKRPTYGTIYQILTNPAYGGAYAFGMTERTTRYDEGVPRRVSRRKPRDQWLALIPGAHDGYIGWEDFERIGQTIAANAIGTGTPGAPKHGAGLLAGLLRCRRCGRKLTVHYTGAKHRILRYACRRAWIDAAEPRCIGFGGIPVDNEIARQVLRVVQPAAVEAAMLAYQDENRMQHEVVSALNRDLDAARYAANRARKQFDGVDPENRLVADELERRWNSALAQVQALEDRISREMREQAPLIAPTLDDFADLAINLESLWHSPNTDARLKKRIVRTLIEEVIADVDASAGEIILRVHWKGGTHTELRLPRRRRGGATATSQDAVAAVRSLARVCSDKVIAAALNRGGLPTGRGNRWTRERVVSLRSHNEIPCFSEETRQRDGWLNLTEAARTVGISTATLRHAVERGEILGKHPLPDGPWIFNRRDLDTERAREVIGRARNRSRNYAVANPKQRNLGFFEK